GVGSGDSNSAGRIRSISSSAAGYPEQEYPRTNEKRRLRRRSSLRAFNAGLFLLDQEILDLFALGGLRRQPARLPPAAGPGFGGVGRVAVFRGHLAQFASGRLPGGLLRCGLAGGAGCAGAATEQLFDRIALGR